MGLLHSDDAKPVGVLITPGEDPLQVDVLQSRLEDHSEPVNRSAERGLDRRRQGRPREEPGRGEDAFRRRTPVRAPGRQRRGVAVHRPDQDPEQQPSVGDRRRQWPMAVQIGAREPPVAADEAGRWLQADESAQRRRDPDGSTNVGGGRERRQACGECRRRTARRSAWRESPHPWIPGRPEKSVGREALERELRDIRLAHQDRPRVAKAPGGDAVAAHRCLTSPEERTEGRGETRRILDVLYEQRQAREWPWVASANGGVQMIGVGERAGGSDRDDRVQVASGFNPPERLLHESASRQRAAADRCGKRGEQSGARRRCGRRHRFILFHVAPPGRSTKPPTTIAAIVSNEVRHSSLLPRGLTRVAAVHRSIDVRAPAVGPDPRGCRRRHRRCAVRYRCHLSRRRPIRTERRASRQRDAASLQRQP